MHLLRHPPLVAAAICHLLVLLTGFAQSPLTISDIRLDAVGRAVVRVPYSSDSYFILYRGDEVVAITNPAALESSPSLAQPAEVELADDLASLTAPARFYRVEQVPLASPKDLDGDGLDDAYELSYRPLLNPLNPADATGDPDRDGFTTLEEYRRRSDPFITDLPPAPLAPILTADLPAATRATLFELSGTGPTNTYIRVEGGAALATNFVAPDGRFAFGIPLAPNRLNRLFISAVATNGVVSPGRPLEIIQDSQPPTLFADFPTNGMTFHSTNTMVAGRVGDSLSGYRGLSVWVHSSPSEGPAPLATTVFPPESPYAATVDVGIGPNGTYERGNVPLIIGTNRITVIATDALGNRTLRQLEVVRKALEGPRLLAVAGDRQMTNAVRRLGEPLSVRVNQPDGTPLADTSLLFEVTRSNGRILPADTNQLTADWQLEPNANTNGAMRLSLRTDAAGEVRVWWTLGSDAGCANNRVCVTSPALSNSVFFCASAMAHPARQLNVGSGNNQKVETGAPVAEPLRVWASDGLNPAIATPITFRVVQGGGKLVPGGRDGALLSTVGPDGTNELSVATGLTGHASVGFISGPEGGQNLIEATFPGQFGLPVTFVVYGVARDASQPGAFTGLILDNTSCPVGGATVVLRVANYERPVTSDAQGRFRFEDVPGGMGHLYVNGRNATHLLGKPIPTNSFPSLSYAVTTVANAENSLPAPVLLPRLNPANAVTYYGTNDLVLTCAGIEGLKFTISANSMTDEKGVRVSPTNAVVVSLDQVHHDNIPMPMPDGVAPPFAWTFQPGGAHFDVERPVKVEYPNMSGLAPGSIAYFLSFNHDTERFEIVSSGHVTDDGARIVTDPGSGITISGWGCNCPPYSVSGECRRPVLRRAFETANPCNEIPATKKKFLLPVTIGRMDIETQWLLNVGAPNGQVNITLEFDFGGSLFSETPLLWEIRRNGPGSQKFANGRILGPSTRVVFSPNGDKDDVYRILVGVDKNKSGEIDDDGEELSSAHAWVRAVSDSEASGAKSELSTLATIAATVAGPFSDPASAAAATVRLFIGETPPSGFEPDRVGSAFVSAEHTDELTMNNGALFTSSCVGVVPKYEYFIGSRMSRVFAQALAYEGLPLTVNDSITGASTTQKAVLIEQIASEKAVVESRYEGTPIGETVNHSFALKEKGGERTTGVRWTSEWEWGASSVPGAGIVQELVRDYLFTAVGSAHFRNGHADIELVRLQAGWRIKSVRVVGNIIDIYDFDPTFLGVEGPGSPLALPVQIGWRPGQEVGGVFSLDIAIDHTWSEAGSEQWPEDHQVLLPKAPSGRFNRGEVKLMGGPVASIGLAPRLDESWLLSANGQTVEVTHGGGFMIPNVSAPDQFGSDGPSSPPDFLGDNYIRVIGVRPAGGTNSFAFGTFFRVRQGETTLISDLTFTDRPIRKPEQLEILTDNRTLRIGTTNQLRVIAHYADGTTNDVTRKTDWTSYRLSNTNLASLTPDGVLVPKMPGIVFVTAMNEAVTAVRGLNLTTADDRFTILSGSVLAPDGRPAAGVEIRVVGLAEQLVATSDPDGSFSFEGLPTGLTRVAVHAWLAPGAGDGGAWAALKEIELAGGVLKLAPLKLTAIGPSTAVHAIAAGYYHTVALREDGTLWAWGKNEHGQLGDGTPTDRSSPAAIMPSEEWQGVAAGKDHTVALRRDGMLWTWGDNGMGQLGDGTRSDRWSPVAIHPFEQWQAVAAGWEHTVAVRKDGTLWAWGRNSEGQLGDETAADRQIPTVIFPSEQWRAVAAGTYHTAALRADGTLWTWGANAYGQLGDGTSIGRRSPIAILPNERWRAVATGDAFTVALHADGTLWAWGQNGSGQLGDGTVIARRLLPRPILPGERWLAVSARGGSTAALRVDGTLWVWGNNTSGQLGDGSTSNRSSPTPIQAAESWRAIAAGWNHTVALRSDGTLWASGMNAYGMFGNGTQSAEWSPPVLVSSERWQAVVAGSSHTLALQEDGRLWVWGYGGSGLLGNGIRVNRQRPTVLLPNERWQAIATDDNHSLAVRADGTLWAWGWNSSGQLGDGTAVARPFPKLVLPAERWRAVAAGGNRSLAVRADGTLWAWGANEAGQLGDGTQTGRWSPTVILPSARWQSVAVGDLHSVAVQEDGTLWTWGNNFRGELGDGTRTDRWSPTAILPAERWRAVAAGKLHTVAIREDGSLWKWGGNISGHDLSPTSILPEERWKSVAAGGADTVAVRADGMLWSWRYDFAGQSGDGTSIHWQEPTAILPAERWQAVTTSGGHTLALREDGTLWGWGSDGHGQLGISPWRQVLGGAVWGPPSP
jgi:alpha-tubulin suppressor-like RCC1 family protein